MTSSLTAGALTFSPNVLGIFQTLADWTRVESGTSHAYLLILVFRLFRLRIWSFGPLLAVPISFLVVVFLVRLVAPPLAVSVEVTFSLFRGPSR